MYEKWETSCKIYFSIHVISSLNVDCRDTKYIVVRIWIIANLFLAGIFVSAKWALCFCATCKDSVSESVTPFFRVTSRGQGIYAIHDITHICLCCFALWWNFLMLRDAREPAVLPWGWYSVRIEKDTRTILCLCIVWTCRICCVKGYVWEIYSVQTYKCRLGKMIRFTRLIVQE